LVACFPIFFSYASSKLETEGSFSIEEDEGDEDDEDDKDDEDDEDNEDDEDEEDDEGNKIDASESDAILHSIVSFLSVIETMIRTKISSK
jgi:hypothetical protein